MRQSLATKLTLAFLAIGVLGALLVAVVSNIQVRARFSQLILEQESNSLADELAAFYAEESDWGEVEQFLAELPNRSLPGRWIVLVNSAENEIIRWPPEGRVNLNEATDRNPIVVDRETVATLIHETPRTAPDGGLPRAETNFLRAVTSASFISAGLAVVCALLLGILLARRLMQPINALTEATQAMAGGELGTQVQVTSRDEIGRLAHSFNQMSHDLAHAQQLRTQMTADIAHDLRTPLSILQGYLEGLKDGELEGTPQLYQVLYEEAQQLNHLINELRTLSLADAGELTLKKQLIDPRALLERSGLAYVMQAERQAVAMHIEAADDLPEFAADLERMTQLLNNLISNALRYTQAGESITLTALADGANIVLQVSDTGVGINSAELPHIFDRFYRVDKSRGRADSETASSGLGLAIARAIVTAHEGTITVQSVTAPNTPSGTQFTIFLPIAENKATH